MFFRWWHRHSGSSLLLAALAAATIGAGCRRGGSSAGAGVTPHPLATKLSAPPTAVPPARTATPLAGGLDACALITQADAEAAAGQALGPGVHESSTNCVFRGAAISPRLTATALRGTPQYPGTSVFNGLKSAAARPQPVPDLGDEAFASGTTLVVRSGEAVIQLSLVSNQPADTVQTQLRRLAQTALARAR